MSATRFQILGHTLQSSTPSKLLRSLAVLVAVAVLATAPASFAQQPLTALAPIDPQQVQDQDDMTWADYKPIPGVDWTDPKHVAGRTINIALVVADFEDQPFVVTLPKHSDLFGNPQIDPIAREEVAQFYHDFWNKPQDINHHHTVHEYWMELSHGKIGVDFDAYGPYRMPRKMIEYGGTVNGARGFGGGGGRRGRRGGGDQTTQQTPAAAAVKVAAICKANSTKCGAPTPATSSTTSYSAFTPAMTKRASGKNSAK